MTNETLPARMETATAVEGFSGEQIDLIRRTVAVGATDLELQMFLATAERLDLDPILHEIHFVKYGSSVIIQVGIDGYRKRAQAVPDFAGYVGPWWCGNDGIWKDVWLSDKAPAAAKIGVCRTGFREPVYAVARYSSYVQKNNKLWGSMPEVMLANAAERLAIRKAFPRLFPDMSRAAGGVQLELEGEVHLTVDPATGEMLSAPGPAYTPENANAPLLRRIHQAGKDKGLNHDDLHDLSLGIANAKGANLTSMSELELPSLEGFLAYLDRSSPESLRRRLDGIRAKAGGATPPALPPPVPTASAPEAPAKPKAAPQKRNEIKDELDETPRGPRCADCGRGIDQDQVEACHGLDRALCPKCAWADAAAKQVANAAPLGADEDPFAPGEPTVAPPEQETLEL